MAKQNTQGIQKTVITLLKHLSSRNKDIISRRFGLKNGKKETLESIGSDYKITRERVRQIEEASLTQLAKTVNEHPEVAMYASEAKAILTGKGGVAKESDLFKNFSGQAGENVANAALVFILALSPELIRFSENEHFHSLWAVNNSTLDSFKQTTASLVKITDKVGKAVPENDFYYLAGRNNIFEQEARLIMAVNKDLNKNIFNEVGLASWPEIKPKGVRDKAYLVLKKEKQPKHFQEIAKLINTSGFNGKKANVQTVHNELIKDSRFVLVGRGTYALAEWGYKAGTVKDVLVDILKSHGRPMPKATLVAKVMAARLVKENTVLLNLQDSKTFIKNEDGSYTLKS